MSDAILYLGINFLLYLFLLIIYQKKKRTFDIGTFILLTWTIASAGSIWYYTKPLTHIFYPNITLLPLIYIYIINLIIFCPFLKVNYTHLKAVNTYNLNNVLYYLSIFLGALSVLPFLNLLYDLTQVSLSSTFLAEMYSAEEDRANLLFLPQIKPLYSIIRHFPGFIIFLFFYNLTLKRKRTIVIFLLAISVLMFLLMAMLSGSRGGMLASLVQIFFFAFFMKSMFNPVIFRKLVRFSIFILAMIVIGISAISISRLGYSHEKGKKNITMDTWIAQYAGEGMIRFDDTVWNNDYQLNGYQTLPVVYYLFDKDVKDFDKITDRNERKCHEIVTVFYTYIGDLYLDFGRYGTILAALILMYVINTLIKVKNYRISLYRLIILNWFFVLVTIGFTADIYRTYYTQINIVYELGLLLCIYLFQIMTVQKNR